MATCKQVSDRLKSIWLTKQMQIQYLCCTKIQENLNIIVEVAYLMSLLLMKANFRRQIVIFLSLNYSGGTKNHFQMLHYFFSIRL